jgi:mRNA interferase RelE/StbE
MAMSYQVEFDPEALEQLTRLSSKNQARILRKINWLANNFEQVVPLGLRANLSGYCKLRIGDHRVLYRVEPEPELLTIVRVGHRREIYEA